MIYTVGFIAVTGDNKNKSDWDIILIRKSYPENHRLNWQNGLLNAIGGKLEKDELPDDCMKREAFEELKINIDNWSLFCITEKAGDTNSGDEVYFYKSYLQSMPQLPEFIDSGEKIEIIKLGEVNYRKDLIDNLHWLIPMAYMEHQPILAEVIYKGN